MKATFNEYDGCFGIDFEAESIPEAALLTRFAVNHLPKINHLSTTVSEKGLFQTSIVFAKNKRSSSAVPKRK